jgi:hypothetical protein
MATLEPYDPDAIKKAEDAALAKRVAEESGPCITRKPTPVECVELGLALDKAQVMQWGDLTIEDAEKLISRGVRPADIGRCYSIDPMEQKNKLFNRLTVKWGLHKNRDVPEYPFATVTVSKMQDDRTCPNTPSNDSLTGRSNDDLPSSGISCNEQNTTVKTENAQEGISLHALDEGRIDDLVRGKVRWGEIITEVPLLVDDSVPRVPVQAELQRAYQRAIDNAAETIINGTSDVIPVGILSEANSEEITGEAITKDCWTCGHSEGSFCNLPTTRDVRDCIDMDYLGWIPREISEAVRQAAASGEIKIETVERPAPAPTIDLAGMIRFTPGNNSNKRENMLITITNKNTLRICAGLIMAGPEEFRGPDSKFMAGIYLSPFGKQIAIVPGEANGYRFNGSKSVMKKANAAQVAKFAAEMVTLPAVYECEWNEGAQAWVGKLMEKGGVA